MAEAELLRTPTPLPATTGDLLAQRKLKSNRTINDLVEDIFVKLWENSDFVSLNDAIYDSQAVEKSRAIDDTIAALMIRDMAKKNQNPAVANEPLDAIVRAMKVARRRFNVGRLERYENAEVRSAEASQNTHAD